MPPFSTTHHTPVRGYHPPPSMEPSEDAGRPKGDAEDEYRARKRAEIIDACRWRLVGALETLGESRGGFLDDELRSMACECSRTHQHRFVPSDTQSQGPILLGVSDGSEKPDSEADDAHTSWKSLPPHKDEEQVQLDVNRAFIYYPQGM